MGQQPPAAQKQWTKAAMCEACVLVQRSECGVACVWMHDTHARHEDVQRCQERKIDQGGLQGYLDASRGCNLFRDEGMAPSRTRDSAFQGLIPRHAGTMRSDSRQHGTQTDTNNETTVQCFSGCTLGMPAAVFSSRLRAPECAREDLEPHPDERERSCSRTASES